MQKDKMLVFTGGHHNSALALAKKFHKAGYRILWLGHRYSMAGNLTLSQEYQDVQVAGFKFFDLKSGKIHGGNFLSLVKTVRAFFICLGLFVRNRPTAVISFGGYLAVPATWAAWLLSIPAVTHEQTTVLGLANRVILPVVRKIYLSWPNMEINRHSKAQLVGLPLEFIKNKLSKLEFNKLLYKEFGVGFKNLAKPIILISGGKQGCHFLNELIEKNLEQLLLKYNLLHQTGNNQQTRDFERLKDKQKHLKDKLGGNYLLFKYSLNFANFIQNCDLIIGRSGAHTVYQILQSEQKLLAIPLPFAYHQEQLHNAQILEQLGLAQILEQDKISTEPFLQAINLLLNKSTDDKLVKKFKKQIPANSLELMFADIQKLLGQRS